MNVGSVSELLPYSMQVKRILFEPEKMNSKTLVYVNGCESYTTETHTDKESNYLSVVKGEKSVYAGRAKQDVPDMADCSELQCVYHQILRVPGT